MITIFTPTYNRAYILENLYNSLKGQTCKDFEWIVIDDGSTDNTSEILAEWMRDDRDFDMICHTVENGGKHRAINKAVRIANSNAFFIVDSDDYLLPEAVEKANKWFSTIENDDEFAGISGLKGYSADKPVGGFGSFTGEYVDATNIQRYLYNLNDDKAEIYKTEILKKYPFPEFEGETFVPEPVVWDHIARDGYKLRWYNEVIYICDYLEDGLTASGNRKFINNPKGFLSYLAMLETVYDVKEVNVFRLDYYNSILKEYGQERLFEIIGWANEMKEHERESDESFT